MSADNQKTILLVEDEAITAMAEKMTLEKFGYKVIIANSGEEAVETVEKTPAIDLILMDINLGAGIDGPEAAAIILGRRDLPVVFLSSHTEPEVVEKTEKITSYGYVVKNSSITVLDASIKMAFKLFEAIINEKEKESQMEAALAALRESEQRLRDIIFNMADWVWEVDGNGVYTYSSEKGLDFLGSSRGDIIGKTPFDFMPADEAKRVAPIFSEIVANKRPIKDLENWNIGKNGERICLLTNGLPILDEKGNLKGYRGVDKDITERKRAESQREAALEALRESQERYRALVENASDLVYKTDKTGNFTYVNRAAVHISGYEEGELIGKLYTKVIRPDMRVKALKFYGRQLGRGIHNTYFEIPLITKDGREICLGQNAQLIIEDGQVAGFQAVARDITERKRAEEALQESEEKYRTLVEKANEEISIAQDGVLVFVNRRMSEFLGVPVGALEGKPFIDFVWPEDREMVSANYRKRIAGEPVRDAYDFRIIGAGGVLNWIFLSSAVIQWNGKPATLNLLTDITERKQAESQREAALEALRKIEERQQLILATLPIAIFTSPLDPEIDTSWVSGDIEKVTGFTVDQYMAENDFWRNRLHTDDRERVLDAYKNPAVGDEIVLEYRWLCKDGNYKWFYDRTIIKHTHQGIQYFGIILDITARKQAEVEIQRQLAEKEILLKEVHHRIKNNIASIGGLLSLHVQSATNPEAIAVLQEAIGRVNSMRILYDKLLLSEDYQDISVKNYLDDLIDTIIAIFPDNAKITLDKRIADFHLDSKRLFPLGIIINELLTNIMKYAFTNRDAGLVKISLTNVDNRVTLTIQDNGIGLPAGFDINEPEGFGLKLVKMLSQQLGGSFSIEKHAGTRCMVEFDI